MSIRQRAESTLSDKMLGIQPSGMHGAVHDETGGL
jgi:hypothetical protein